METGNNQDVIVFQEQDGIRLAPLPKGYKWVTEKDTGGNRSIMILKRDGSIEYRRVATNPTTNLRRRKECHTGKKCP